MKALFQRVVLGRPMVAFLVMGASFLAFGAASLDLVNWLQADTRYIAENGWAALIDGGARQALELLLDGYVAMAAYVVFKACERALVDALLRPAKPPAPTRIQDRKDTP